LVNARVLVVEDESIEAMGIERKLKRLGYIVPAVVASGEEAVKKAEETQPDLVLMDIRLKGDVDGIEAAKQIRSRFNIPVVYLTAYADEETLQRAKITEPNGYILKPFEERELRSNIEMALYKHKMETKMRIKDKAIDSSINAVAIADIDGNISYVNRSFLTMWGYENSEEVLRLSIVKFWQGKRKTAEIFDTVMNKGGWIGELIAERKDGSLFDVQLSANLVTDKADTPLCMMCSFVDITKRKRAEEETIRTKEYLQNIINSASEIVISFDTNAKVTTWNKTAEFITGYNRGKVIGRSLNKLDVFDNPQELLDIIKNVSSGKKIRPDESILLTKDGAKRIIRFSYSALKGDEERYIGVLAIGKDITHDKELHGKLLKGNSYVIPEKNNKSSLDLFNDLTKLDYEGLLITRANPEIVKNMITSANIQVILLNHDTLGGFENISDLDGLIAKIKEFCVKNTNINTVILLDRIDYLLTNFSFESFVKTLYQINHIVSKNKSMLLVHFDPSIVEPKQMAVIENELQPLPSQKIEDIKIEDETYDILKFIHDQNQINLLVSFKKIMGEFNIVYATLAKKLKLIENEGLIFTKRHGKFRTVYISEKGKTLLNKRRTA